MDLPLVAKKMPENIWEEIHKVNICNNNFHSKSKIKNALRGMAFNFINIEEDSRIYKNANHIKVIKQSIKDVAILKHVKGSDVVLINNKDYTTSVGSPFKDTKKLKYFGSDLTITEVKTLQSYLSTLHKWNDLIKEEYNTMRPNNDN